MCQLRTLRKTLCALRLNLTFAGLSFQQRTTNNEQRTTNFEQ